MAHIPISSQEYLNGMYFSVPTYHQFFLQVAKMPLYAASWAIQEIQKITLDPK